MLYKTIVLELLRERTALHERLRASRTLLSTMNRFATELKAAHETWIEQLGLERPGGDPSQIASEALELALRDLTERLPTESSPEEEEPSLDAAMNYLRRHTPTA